MLIAVIGGKLQGIEILYLAKKAGLQTLLIDKNPDCTARHLCDQFIEFSFSPEQTIPPKCPAIDFILPAIEDDEVLATIVTWSESTETPLLFDPESYRISSSKIVSDRLFAKMKLPAPKQWPECDFPVVVKPDVASGSRGVQVIENRHLLDLYLKDQEGENKPVVQEYINGPSYSIEVIGCPGNYMPLQVTALHMDKDYDCKRVTCPALLPADKITSFEQIATTLAEEMQLSGIMDFEVVLHDNLLKLLEIDARFPSQTPMAVYWSSGINMVALLCELFNEADGHESTCPPSENIKTWVSVEHIRVQKGHLEVCGEHIMVSDSPLILQQNFFGATEALTSFQPGKKEWVATMIFTGSSEGEVTINRQKSYNLIRQQSQIINSSTFLEKRQ